MGASGNLSKGFINADRKLRAVIHFFNGVRDKVAVFPSAPAEPMPRSRCMGGTPCTGVILIMAGDLGSDTGLNPLDIIFQTLLVSLKEKVQWQSILKNSDYSTCTFGQENIV